MARSTSFPLRCCSNSNAMRLTSIWPTSTTIRTGPYAPMPRNRRPARANPSAQASTSTKSNFEPPADMVRAQRDHCIMIKPSAPTPGPRHAQRYAAHHRRSQRAAEAAPFPACACDLPCCGESFKHVGRLPEHGLTGTDMSGSGVTFPGSWATLALLRFSTTAPAASRRRAEGMGFANKLSSLMKTL